MNLQEIDQQIKELDGQRKAVIRRIFSGEISEKQGHQTLDRIRQERINLSTLRNDVVNE